MGFGIWEMHAETKARLISVRILFFSRLTNLLTVGIRIHCFWCHAWWSLLYAWHKTTRRMIKERLIYWKHCYKREKLHDVLSNHWMKTHNLVFYFISVDAVLKVVSNDNWHVFSDDKVFNRLILSYAINVILFDIFWKDKDI